MLYLDASALVKRYVAEEGSDVLLSAMENASGWTMCRIGYVETVRAVIRAGASDAREQVDSDWLAIDVVEVDQALAEHAAELTTSAELRSLDALHLAAALVLPSQGLTFATWDHRLHRAAHTSGLKTLPPSL